LDTKYRSDLKKNLQDELGDGWKEVLGEDWKEDVGGDGWGQYYRIDRENPENSDKPSPNSSCKFFFKSDLYFVSKIKERVRTRNYL
jgi:hypothetical protein